MHLPEGTLIADRFKIEALAGRGGMGVVYRALDVRDQRPVAVKLLSRSGKHQERAERFAREASVIADLSHPAIVSYVAHGETADRKSFLVME